MKMAYAWAVNMQGYTGSYDQWLRLPATVRAEYEAGAAGIPTEETR